MASNLIQFQHGMSLPQLIQCFGTETAYVDALQRARWPAWFICQRCGGSAHCVVCSASRRRFQSNACHVQTSMTVGTLFAITKLPLPTCFLAIYLLSQGKTGISALALKCQISVSYPTAWLMHHKVMKAMADREAAHRLCDAVEVDDACLGGERAGGKPSRGSENKVPIAAALSLSNKGHSLYVKVTQVPGFTNDAISKWARSNLAPVTAVLSDGLACFGAVTEAGCTHSVEAVGKRKPRDLAQFKWVNTVLGQSQDNAPRRF